MHLDGVEAKMATTEPISF